MNINWKQKLTSRKFWAAVIGFVSPTIIAFGVSSETATQVVAIIMAGAVLIAYIVGEGMVDAERVAGTDTAVDDEDHADEEMGDNG